VFAKEGDWGYTITGSLDGVPFMAFEYQWWVQSLLVRGGRTKTISAMIWTLEEDAPQFVLTPEGMYKWFVVPLWPRIRFEPPAGLEGYWLQGTDEARIGTFFGPSVRAYFAANRYEHLAGGGRELMWWRWGHLPSPEKLEGFLAMGQRIRALFAAKHAAA